MTFRKLWRDVRIAVALPLVILASLLFTFREWTDHDTE